MRFEYPLRRFGVVWAEPGEIDIFAQGDTGEEEKQEEGVVTWGAEAEHSEQSLPGQDSGYADNYCKGEQQAVRSFRVSQIEYI